MGAKDEMMLEKKQQGIRIMKNDRDYSVCVWCVHVCLCVLMSCFLKFYHIIIAFIDCFAFLDRVYNELHTTVLFSFREEII